MSEENLKDQREHLRIPVSWKVRVTRTNKQTLIVRLDNISRGGGHILGDLTCKKGETVLLESSPMINGQAYPVRLIAKIVHTHLLAQNQGVGAGFCLTRANDTFQQLMEMLEERHGSY